MAICNPRYPSNISDITQVDGFENILSDDPTKKFNREDLSTLNILFNTLLNNTDLAEYPQLQERNRRGAVTDQEFADMILDKGVTLDYIKDAFLNNFPVEIDYDSVKNLITQTESAINDEIRRASEQNGTQIPSSTFGDTGDDRNVLNDTTLNSLLSNTSISTGVLTDILGNKPATNQGIAGGSFGTGLYNEGKLTGKVRAGDDISTSTGAGTLNRSTAPVTTIGETGNIDPSSVEADEKIKTTITVSCRLIGDLTPTQSQGDRLTLTLGDGTVILLDVVGETRYNQNTNRNINVDITLEDNNGTITILDSNGNTIITSNVTLRNDLSTIDQTSSTEGALVIERKDGSNILDSNVSRANIVIGEDVQLTTSDYTSSIVSDSNNLSTTQIYTNTGFDITTSNTGFVQPPLVYNIEQPETGLSNNPWVPGTQISSIFDLAEDYYRQVFGGNNNGFAANFNKNACSGFSNPFAKLISLVSAIGAAQNLAAGTLNQIPDIGSIVSNISGQFGNLQSILGKAGGLINILSGDINNLINGIKEYANLSGIIQGLSRKLGSYQQQLLDLPDKIKGAMLSQVNGLQQTSQLFFNQNIGSSKGLFKFVNKKIEKTKEFYSSTIIDNIKEKINKFFDLNTQQFEDLLPNVLNFLLLKGCGLSNLIEGLMRAPVDRLKSLISSITSNHDIMSSYSNQVRNNVLHNGGIRIPPNQRKKESQRGVENWNNTKGYIIPNDFTQPSNYVKPAITQQEYNEVLRNINGDGLSGSFYFIRRNVSEMGKRAKEKYEASKDNPAAYGRVYGKLHTEVWDANQNFHDTEADVDMGWKFIVDNNPTLWIMLHRVSQRLQNEGYLSSSGLQVNSAFRSPYYNYFLTGGAKASNHMKGMALDIGKATIGSDEQQAAFIRACSDEGFIRIVAYGSFFHIDVGPGIKSSHWTSKGNLGTLARSAWETHATT